MFVLNELEIPYWFDNSVFQVEEHILIEPYLGEVEPDECEPEEESVD